MYVPVCTLNILPNIIDYEIVYFIINDSTYIV